MNPGYYLLITWIMLTRIAFSSRGHPMRGPAVLWKTLVECLPLLVFSIRWPLMAVVVFLALMNAATWAVDRTHYPRGLRQFLLFLAYALAFGFIPDALLQANQVAAAVWQYAGDHLVPAALLSSAGLEDALPMIAGAVFVTYEVNNPLRFILARFNVEPREPAMAQAARPLHDHAELQRGMIIGIIERLLIYYFVVTGSLASIGFIIAAKSFARFRELDNKEFAEYVLIGTLLSTAAALFTAAAVRLLQ